MIRANLYLVAFNLIPAFFFGPKWASFIAISLLSLRFTLEFAGLKMPPRAFLWLMQIVISGSVWHNYHSFLGEQAAGALLTLLSCVKIYELNSRRDHFFSGLLCFLVLMSYLLSDQGLVMTAYMIADIVFILGFLYALETNERYPKEWKPMLWNSVVLTLKAAPILILTFVLFPRFSTGLGTSGENQGQTGINDKLSPGSISQLVGSDELIFRATFLTDALPSTQNLYWRGAILDLADGLAWERAPEIPSRWTVKPARQDIEVYLETGSQRFLFTLDPSKNLGFPNDSTAGNIVKREGNVYQLEKTIAQRERYYLEKLDDSVPEPAPAANYTRVLTSPSAEMRAFLRPFRGRPSRQIVQDLLVHFNRGGFRYSMQPPAIKSMDDFFFKTKIGFCEHYAATLATLLRYLGVPSRVVIGFQGGTPSLLENFITVRGHDAHAWIEYYDNISQHWRRVDPTAEVAPLRLALGSESYMNPDRNPWLIAYFKSRAFMDEMESAWVGFLIRFDLARQKELLASLGLETVPFQVLLVFLVLGLVLFGAILYFFEAQKREPMTFDEKIYRRLVRVLKRWGIEKESSDGPMTLYRKVEALDATAGEGVLQVLQPIIQARFGGQTLSREMQSSVRASLRNLRKLSIKKPRR